MTYFSHPSVQAKGQRSFFKWADENSDLIEVCDTFKEACDHFESAYLALRGSKEVITARMAKASFKNHTMDLLKAGHEPENLKVLLFGLNPKTVAKVDRWAAQLNNNS